MTRAHSCLRWTGALAALALSLACAAEPEPQMTDDETRAREMAAAYTAAWGSRDPSRVAGHYAKCGSLQINAGDAAVGREAITASAQAFMTSLPDMIVTMDSLTMKGSSTIYHWTLTGTNSGRGGTGKAIRISGYEEWTLASDGLIAQSLGHFDEAEYARQVRDGATP